MKDTNGKQQTAELENELRATKEELVACREQSEKTQVSGNELIGLLVSAGIGVLCLDTRLYIKSATSCMQELFNIIPADVGRPITDLVSNLLYETLEQDVKQVINSARPMEKVVHSEDGRWFNLRILPQLKAGDVVSTILVTVTEITKLKQKGETE